MDEIVQRILDCAKENGLEQKDLARKIGVHPQVITAWKNQEKPSKSYRKYVDSIAEILGTTSDYLLTGQKENPAPKMEDGIDENINRLLDVLGDLTPEEQRQVIAYAQGIQAGHKTPASDHT